MADFTESFCSADDVTARTGLPISATTKPTQTQVALVAKSKAAEIQASLFKAGVTVSDDDGDDPVATTDTPGKILRERLRDANAVAVAIEQIVHHFKGISPAQTEKIAGLRREYKRILAELPELAVDVEEEDAGNTSDYRSPYDSEVQRTAPDADGQVIGAGLQLTIDGDEL